MHKQLLAVTITCMGCSDPAPANPNAADTGATATDSGGGGDDSASSSDTTTGADTTTTGSDTAPDSGTGADTAVSDTPTTGGKWTSVKMGLALGTVAPKGPLLASLSTKIVAFSYNEPNDETWEFNGTDWAPKQKVATMLWSGLSDHSITGWKDKAYLFGAKADRLAVYEWNGASWTVVASGGRWRHKAVAWANGIFLAAGYLTASSGTMAAPQTFNPTTKMFASHADPGELGMLLSTGPTATAVFGSAGHRYDGSWGGVPKTEFEPVSAIGNGSEIFAISGSNRTWIQSAGKWRDAAAAPCANAPLGAIGSQVFAFCNGTSYQDIYRWVP